MSELSQSFHDNGNLSAEGQRVDGLRQGEWRFFYEEGPLKSRGEYVDDKPHGPYRWFDPQGGTTTIGGFFGGERHGEWTWFYAGTEQPQSLRTYDKGKQHGWFRTWAADGTLLQEIGFHQGEYHGPFLKRRADGSPEEQANYHHGVLDGERLEWSDKGRKTRAVFRMGVPELTDKRKQSLASQVTRAKSSYAKLKVFEKVAPYRSRHAVLWALVREGFIDAAADPELWGELADGAEFANAADVLALLTAVKRAPKNYGLRLGCWPQGLEDLTEAVFQREPQPFLEGWKGVSPMNKRGLATLLRRHGHVGREALPKDIAKRMATAHVEHYGLRDTWTVVVDGERQAWKIRDNQLPTERFRPFVELFCDWGEWERAVLEVTLKKDYNVDANLSVDAFHVADAEQLQRLLDTSSHGPHYTPAIYRALKARGDAPETLLAVAAAVNERRPYVAEIAVVVAVEALLAAGQPIPESVDPLLSCRAFTEQGSQGYTFLDETKAAFAALPPERRRARLRALLEQDYLWSYTLPVISTQPDEDLMELALDRVAADQSANVPHYNRHARAIATWGDAALPRFVARADSLPEGKPRDCFVQAVLYLLAARAEAGGVLPPELDRFLQFKGYVESGLADHYFLHNVLPPLRAVLRALPVERSGEALMAGLESGDLYFARAFRAVPDVRDHGLRIRAFRYVAENAERLRMPERDWLRWAVDELKAEAVPLVVAALSVVDHPQLRKSFSEGLGQDLWKQVEEQLGAITVPTRLVDLLEVASERYLSAHPGAAREVIYLLERADEPPEAGAVARVGGLPVGVTDETWPLRSDAAGDPEARREHVFTLDLREMPELQRLLGGAAAFAFFMDDAGDNEAYQPGNAECTWLLLTEDDLAAGEYEGELAAGASARAVRARRIEVPAAAFFAREGELDELRSQIYRASARALGEPIWLQSEEHWGTLLMQFDEAFADVNLGDMGVMYVFSDTAFWQCH